MKFQREEMLCYNMQKMEKSTYMDITMLVRYWDTIHNWGRSQTNSSEISGVIFFFKKMKLNSAYQKFGAISSTTEENNFMLQDATLKMANLSISLLKIFGLKSSKKVVNFKI